MTIVDVQNWMNKIRKKYPLPPPPPPKIECETFQRYHWIVYACLLHSVQIICDKVTGAHSFTHARFYKIVCNIVWNWTNVQIECVWQCYYDQLVGCCCCWCCYLLSAPHCNGRIYMNKTHTSLIAIYSLRLLAQTHVYIFPTDTNTFVNWTG